MSEIAQLTRFEHRRPPGCDGAPNTGRRCRAEDAELRCVLERSRAIRVGYDAARLGEPDRYLRKWSVVEQVDYEMGRLVACELRAEFGAAPEWPAGDSDKVLAALTGWRSAHPGEMVTPNGGVA